MLYTSNNSLCTDVAAKPLSSAIAIAIYCTVVCGMIITHAMHVVPIYLNQYNHDLSNSACCLMLESSLAKTQTRLADYKSVRIYNGDYIAIFLTIAIPAQLCIAIYLVL